MKTFLTTNGMSVKVDDVDYKWVAQFYWYAMPTGHVVHYLSNTVVHLHRLITGAGSGQVVDHANRDPLDNRRCNLRPTTQRFNRANSDKMVRNGQPKSRYKGVTRIGGKRRKKPWQVYFDGQYLGTFAVEEDAARAYDTAAMAFGEFALTNAMLFGL